MLLGEVSGSRELSQVPTTGQVEPFWEIIFLVMANVVLGSAAVGSPNLGHTALTRVGTHDNRCDAGGWRQSRALRYGRAGQWALPIILKACQHAPLLGICPGLEETAPKWEVGMAAYPHTGARIHSQVNPLLFSHQSGLGRRFKLWFWLILSLHDFKIC